MKTKKNEANENKPIPIREAAQLARCHIGTTYEYIRRGEIALSPHAFKMLVAPSEIHRWLQGMSARRAKRQEVGA
jgi:Helix-turn-helix domain